MKSCQPRAAIQGGGGANAAAAPPATPETRVPAPSPDEKRASSPVRTLSSAETLTLGQTLSCSSLDDTLLAKTFKDPQMATAMDLEADLNRHYDSLEVDMSADELARQEAEKQSLSAAGSGATEAGAGP